VIDRENELVMTITLHIFTLKAFSLNFFLVLELDHDQNLVGEEEDVQNVKQNPNSAVPADP
jgi:hypothetical protein